MKYSSEHKDFFKFLIKEFHTNDFPQTLLRDAVIPLSSKKIITLYGPRRSGKSYFFYTQIKMLREKGIPLEEILYVNFEDERILPLNGKDLGVLLEAYYELYSEKKGHLLYFFLDEIQAIPDWEVFIRRIHDQEKIRLFLTGSSSKLLSKEIGTSLRGRTVSFPMFPLHFREFLRFRKFEFASGDEYSSKRFELQKLLNEYLEFGGFPEVALEKNLSLKKKILDEYFRSLLHRDLAERFSLENLPLLREILKFLFSNTTHLFSINAYYKTIENTMKVSRDTITRYLAALSETEYFFFLPKFSYSLKEQQVNHKKIIALDNGLRNQIAFTFSDDAGKKAENLVGSILSRKEEALYYWKDHQEVDFVLHKKNNLVAINVSYGNSIPSREISSLREFQKKYPRANEKIIITKEEEGKHDGIHFIPLWKWLLFHG